MHDRNSEANHVLISGESIAPILCNLPTQSILEGGWLVLTTRSSLLAAGR